MSYTGSADIALDVNGDLGIPEANQRYQYALYHLTRCVTGAGHEYIFIGYMENQKARR